MKSDLVNQIDEIFCELDKPDSPGCSLGIIKQGELIYQHGYGMANLESNVPIIPASVFDLGSTSKQFTALSILLLSRHKKLSLSDPIQKYLPEIPVYENPITIRHLIHHTSGLRDYLMLMILAGMPLENDYQEDEVVKLISRQKGLTFQPGEEHLYCNSGYFLLSEIVNRVSGQSLRKFANENIFEPLGMVNTHFHDNFKEIVKNRVIAYSPLEEGGFEIDTGIFDVLGDGAVFSNTYDLFLWDQNFYHNILDGGDQTLIDQMLQCGRLNNNEQLNYAFGLYVSKYKGLNTVYHGGAWYGYRSQMIRFPDHHFSVICLANYSMLNPDMLCKKVVDLFLNDEFENKVTVVPAMSTDAKVDLSQESLSERTGFYQNLVEKEICEITSVDGSLFAHILGQNLPLCPKDNYHFLAAQSILPIEIIFEQGFQSLQIDFGDGSLPQRYTRLPKFQPTITQLSEFQGDYYSEELDITYRLRADRNCLKLIAKNALVEDVKAIDADYFTAGLFTIKICRTKLENIDGFYLDAGKTSGFYFKKLVTD